MASPLRALPEQQLALDETLIEDVQLEQALEERQRCKVVLGDTRKEFKEAADAANVEIAKLELPESKAVRVGRFRITRSAVSARQVSFETQPTTRIRITLLDADDE